MIFKANVTAMQTAGRWEGLLSPANNMVIVALLHNSAEGHGRKQRLDDLEHSFGKDWARILDGLSNSPVQDANQKAPWRERREA
jgi:hypothetical protein